MDKERGRRAAGRRLTEPVDKPAVEREERFSILSVSVGALRWFFLLFSAGTIYLTVVNTLNRAERASASGWLDIQRIATEELARAGAAAGVGSVITVEVVRMVLAALWEERNRRLAQARGVEEGLERGREEGLERGREEGLERGREEGLERGREEAQALWEDWYRRFQEAQVRGEVFDEPPPGLGDRGRPPRAK